MRPSASRLLINAAAIRSPPLPTPSLKAMAKASYAVSDTVQVAPGVHMPRFGFGVYKSDPGRCLSSCLEAYKAGYRHFDSAMLYANEYVWFSPFLKHPDSPKSYGNFPPVMFAILFV